MMGATASSPLYPPLLMRNSYCSWLIVVACLALAPGLAVAEPSVGPLNKIFGKSPEFLPVEQAFPVDAQMTAENAVAVYFEITPGYYLYRHGFAFSVNGTAVQPSVWPRGEQHEDEYFGLVEVYRDNIGFRLPIPAHPGGPLELRVGYQGCADAGLCYPPAEKQFQLTATAQAAERAAPTPPEPDSGATGATELQGLFWFLLAGLGLTFTPCVLPMLPILSSVILGPGRRVSNRRATALTLTYVGSMATTFALAGVLVGYFGARLNLQAHLQNPWIISAFAGMFVLLALSMFDLYQIRLPERLARASSGAGGEAGSLANAAFMGAISSLVVSPCVTAPLAGALLYIAATGDALYGGLALLALGGGMGIPLIIAGVSGGRFLPRSGPWMVGVKRLFGVMMIGVAVWMLERFMAGPATLAMWAALALLTAAGAWATATGATGRLKVSAAALAMTSFLLGGIWLAGALSGGTSMWRPLEQLQGTAQTGPNISDFHDIFVEVRDMKTLNAALESSRGAARPVFLDVYADWCISCRIMEHEVLGSRRVQERLAGFTLIRADVTDTTPASMRILEHFQVFGPPAWIFMDAAGQEIREMRIVGEINEDQFISMLDQHKSLSSP